MSGAHQAQQTCLSTKPRPAEHVYATVSVTVADEASGREVQLQLSELATMGEARRAAAACLDRSADNDTSLLAEQLGDRLVPCGDAEPLQGRWDLVLLEDVPVPAVENAPRHWRRCAAELAKLMDAMRSEPGAADAFVEGLRRLLEEPPQGCAYCTTAFCFRELAAALLGDLEAARNPKVAALPHKLASLLSQIEGHVFNKTAGSDAAFKWVLQRDGVFGACGTEAADGHFSPAHRHFSPAHRLVFFISLPLALYVRNNPHLYELIRRLRLMRSCARSRASVREVLDGSGPGSSTDQTPYSALVYAIFAALQALRSVAVAARDGAKVGLEALAPLEATASVGSAELSPAEACAEDSVRLMYRGIWVPDRIDEEAARYQWSFNSFSRSLEGVCHVLNFYAGAVGSEASQMAAISCHVLLLVARRASSMAGCVDAASGDWAFPVQFFSGIYGEIEQELIVPPFAAYTFEDGLELTRKMSPEKRAARMAALEQRWGLPLGTLLRVAPLLGDMLDGRAEPLRHLPRSPRVTVRFVRRVDIAAPVRKLLSDGCRSLLEFRVDSKTLDVESKWQQNKRTLT